MSSWDAPFTPAKMLILMELRSVEFVRRTYQEDESYRCVGGSQPSRCSLNAIDRSGHNKWHIKVSSRWMPDQPKKRKPERRLEFEAFISHIDFDSLPPLLHDTVTEIGLTLVTKPSRPDSHSEMLPLKTRLSTLLASGNRFAEIASRLSYTVHEDALRVTYPHLKDLPVPTRWVSDIQMKEEIQDVVPWVSRVQLIDDESWYIYKEIDRPFYSLRDSVVLQRELQNLKLFRGIPSVVQLAAVIISKSPYSTTDRDERPPVMRGILLDYHLEGTLERVLKRTNGSNRPWCGWALQIAEALNQLHLSNNTHMDLKPSNVMIDNEENAVLIDISGIGGVTHEWLAPEIREILDPLSLPFEMRQRNDIWAYGQLLSAMAELSSNNQEKKLMKNCDRIYVASLHNSGPPSSSTCRKVSPMAFKHHPAVQTKQVW
ncbi:predicted protein [Uncinocarpus reesii 1704]|uniref:Protein kinase domain-containing protein n=1 Tax=Uncinocarpus reesii (strain UAMH 1704) TaxID=336963 RepID=C4JI77_UNCRE|nr:uncharacterized protein UREG_02823 [Uncinocarpus reesii 1704]EEP77974.1 predicted protein [Uncinocarpus reesii 1704]